MSRLFDETVAEADDGFDLAAGGAELGAEASDVHVNRARFSGRVVSPYSFEQAIARLHAVAVIDEVPEQIELAPRKAHRRAVHGHRDSIEIGLNPRPAVHGRRCPGTSLLAARAAAHHRS